MERFRVLHAADVQEADESRTEDMGVQVIKLKNLNLKLENYT